MYKDFAIFYKNEQCYALKRGQHFLIIYLLETEANYNS